MRALSSVGLGLTLVSGLLFLALMAELYYLFWWKKRRPINNRDHTITSKYLLHLLCFKNQSTNQIQIQSSLNGGGGGGGGGGANPVASNSINEDSLLKTYGNGEESVEAELMRLHSLSGPPRFLFTIKEETREDLESDDGRSRSRKGSRGRSLGDLLHCTETQTPFLTPLSSPPLFSPQNFNNNNNNPFGFNPLFESSSNSPPPKFKFLKDAEEKLYKRTLMEEAIRAHRNINGETQEETDGSFIRIVVSKSRERGQVTPLPSSPLSLKEREN